MLAEGAETMAVSGTRLQASLAVSQVFLSIWQRVGLLSLETVIPSFEFFSIPPFPISLRYIIPSDSSLANHVSLSGQSLLPALCLSASLLAPRGQDLGSCSHSQTPARCVAVMFAAGMNDGTNERTNEK